MKKRVTSSKPVGKKPDRPIVRAGDFAQASDGLSGNRVFVSIAKTINIGNYESLRAEVGIGRTVPDGMEHNRVLNICMGQAQADCQELIEEIEKTLK